MCSSAIDNASALLGKQPRVVKSMTKRGVVGGNKVLQPAARPRHSILGEKKITTNN